jgi:hypothetical protein
VSIKDIEGLIERAKARPFSSVAILLGLVMAIAVSSWISAYFGEAGKRLASPPAQPPVPLTMPKLNSDAKTDVTAGPVPAPDLNAALPTSTVQHAQGDS